MSLFRSVRPVLVLAMLVAPGGGSSNTVVAAHAGSSDNQGEIESSNNLGRIEGSRWSSLAGNIKGAAIPAGILKVDFTREGKLTYRAGSHVFTGRYSLGPEDYVTFHLDQELAGRKKHREKIKIRGNKLTMTDSDGTSLDFARVR